MTAVWPCGGMRKRRTVVPTEHEEQAALVRWAGYSRSRYPQLEWLYAIPNGGVRAWKTAALLKAEGVKRGVPDLCLPVPMGPFHGAYIEMKRIAESRVTDAQNLWRSHLQASGYAYCLAEGFEPARDFLIAYLDSGLTKNFPLS